MVDNAAQLFDFPPPYANECVQYILRIMLCQDVVEIPPNLGNSGNCKGMGMSYRLT